MFIKFKSALFAIFAGFSAFLGDAVEVKLASLSAPWSHAIVDNFTHAVVACFSWLSVVTAGSSVNKSVMIRETLLCAFLASLVDVDHFITATSWRIADATHLSGRPFLHNTSLLLLIIAAHLIIGRYWLLPWLWNLGWIMFAASISHHIRDATRRGFWLWPFGSTPPTPYILYMFMQVTFPLVLSKLKYPLSVPIVQYNIIETA